jgi:serine O-acetyltransferase
MVAATDIRQLDNVSALKTVDPIWDSMRDEARTAAERDPLLAAFLY